MSKKLIKDKNTWYKFNDGWFTYYVNTLTSEKKFELENGDIEVDGYDYLDDFYRGGELQMNNDNNKMIVTDYGICIRKVIDERTFSDSIVITKEAFIEAYNRWIKGLEDE